MLWYWVEPSPDTKANLRYRVFYPVTKVETFSLGFTVSVAKSVPTALITRYYKAFFLVVALLADY
jgi:hypothetical protein